MLVVSLKNPNTDLNVHPLALGWAHSKARIGGTEIRKDGPVLKYSSPGKT